MLLGCISFGLMFWNIRLQYFGLGMSTILLNIKINGIFLRVLHIIFAENMEIACCMII